MSEPTIPQIIPIPNTFIKDIAGQRFGRLSVIGYVGSIKIGAADCSLAQWLCICDCGAQVIKAGAHLRRRNVTSCGCWNAEKIKTNGQKNRRHGMDGTPEYRTWGNMRARCYNPKSISYSNYGGRGISVCEHWRECFENFFADMGLRPGPEYSIDRIDTNGNYEPGNCRWATRKEQSNNRRSNHLITWGERTHTIAEWEGITGINRDTLWSRLFEHGWSSERALSEKIQLHKSP